MTKASDNAYPSLLITEGSAPSAPAAGKRRLFVDSADHLPKLEDSTGTVVTIGSGGGLTQAYLGYNTVGGSSEVMTHLKWYFKLVTPANDCLLTTVEANIKGNGSNVRGLAAGLWLDSAGSPGNAIAQGPVTWADDSNGTPLVLNSTARWFSFPVSYWLTASTSYWLGVQCNQSAVTPFSLQYDGSGSDKTATASGMWVLDGSLATFASPGNKYSIRGNTIR